MIITLKQCLIPECGRADHRFEFERPTLREVERIQQATGLDFDEWLEGVNAGMSGSKIGGAMIPSIFALVDVLHRRIGVRPAWDDIDVDLYNLDFELEPGEAAEEPDADRAEPDEDEAEAGKGPAPTSPSHQPDEPAEPVIPGSGPDTAAESAPSSSPTPTASGSGSASP